MGLGPRCPHCATQSSEVIDSRLSESRIRRRRECNQCRNRFTTYERTVEKAGPSGKKVSVHHHLAAMNTTITDLQRRIALVIEWDKEES